MKSELFFIILAEFWLVKSYIKSCNLPQLYWKMIVALFLYLECPDSLLTFKCETLEFLDKVDEDNL